MAARGDTVDTRGEKTDTRGNKGHGGSLRHGVAGRRHEEEPVARWGEPATRGETINTREKGGHEGGKPATREMGTTRGETVDTRGEQ